MNHRKLPHKVSVRLSDSEKEKLELNASLAGLKVSAYIRHIMSNARPPIHKFDQSLVVQVAKIGNNINQIAKHVNIDKVIDGVVLKQIIDVNKKLDDLMLQKQNLRS
ncbi:plasmid mobilization protein [Campylobacter concisus]|uniref:plasmid mobilization protein n=1 Tax=Campylobacter concisus TaxID=199 RepID=UPI001652BEC7|nr:plasmid mobilization relaxosome protein MobC [Campylobacter concisus]